MSNFKKIAATAAAGIILAAGATTPADAASQRIYHDYSRYSNMTISVYSGANCTGTRYKIFRNTWKAGQSWRSPYATQWARHGSAIWTNRSANLCMNAPTWLHVKNLVSI